MRLLKPGRGPLDGRHAITFAASAPAIGRYAVPFTSESSVNRRQIACLSKLRGITTD